MAEEMRLHLEQRTDDFVATGLSREEARFAAQREFGGVEQLKEIARDEHGWAWLDALGRDLRFGLRMLRKQPGFTVVAVLTLALGIGATTAIFSVVNSVLLRPLDYPRSSELVVLSLRSPRGAQSGATPASFLAWVREARGFTALAAWVYGPYNLTGEGEPRRVFAQRVTTAYFGILQTTPALGRDFQPGEDQPGKDNVVILSHDLWLSQFGGRASVIGQSIRLDERRCTIIGVMPDTYQFDRRADLYTPCVLNLSRNSAGQALLVLGRLKPDVSLAQAREEMNRINRRPTPNTPAEQALSSVRIQPLLQAKVGGVQPLLLVLLGAVTFLLLIACVNVANLLLARASTRHREIAVRVVLGAGRGRIVRQLLSESLLIAVLGGALGVLVGYVGMRALVALAPEGLPRLEEVSMDGPVLVFACLLALGTGVAFGLIPALEASGVNAAETLKDGGHGPSDAPRRHRRRSLLVVLEVGLALMLLAGAGLVGRSLLRLEQFDPGFRAPNIYMSNIALIPQKYASESQRTAFVEHAIANILRVPGIQAVAFTNHTLPTMGMGGTFFTIEGRPPGPVELPPAYYYAVTPGYFQMLHIPLVRGRLFTAADQAGAPRVALINQNLARQYFPDVNPIGQRISVGNGPDSWRQIVGIVRDVAQNGGLQMRAQVYEPYAQNPSHSTSFIVRTDLPAGQVQPAVAAAIHAVDPDIPTGPLYAIFGQPTLNVLVTRFMTFLLGVFAVTALFLAAIGVYGVMNYAVSRRTGEIGIRMALGAQRRDVLWMILREGAGMVGAGLLLGLVGAIAVSGTLEWLLFEVSPRDPLTLAAIMVLLAGVAFVACWLPARRATKVDPMVALRCE